MFKLPIKQKFNLLLHATKPYDYHLNLKHLKLIEMSENIKIYPNPAKDHIILEKNGSKINIGNSVVIASTLGKELKKVNIKDFYKEKIDISELPVGFYLLFFENGAIHPKMFSKVK